MSLNIEIKAEYPDLEVARRILQPIADFKGVLNQTDTYFHTKKPEQRLKLREIIAGNHMSSELITYSRVNQAEPKPSIYEIYKTTDPESLKKVLEISEGVKVVVRKRRELYLIKNVRFHLDEILGLPRPYVEIEVVANRRQRENLLLAQCESAMRLLHIRSDQLEELSYSDLLLR